MKRTKLQKTTDEQRLDIDYDAENKCIASAESNIGMG